MTTEIKNKIVASDRQLALLGLALREITSPEKPIITRLKVLGTEPNEIANVVVGKIWHLILNEEFNNLTQFKMRVDHKWPTQVEAHTDLFRRAYQAVAEVDVAWGLTIVDQDYELKGILRTLTEWNIEYNRIIERFNSTKKDQDEFHNAALLKARELGVRLNRIAVPTKEQAASNVWDRVNKLVGGIRHGQG